MKRDCMKDQKKIEEELKSIIYAYCRKGITVESISLETRLVENLGFDSISIMQLIVEIENQFGIIFEYNDLNFDTINKYCNLLMYILCKLETFE